MAGNVHELRPKVGGDTEKVTINLGYVDLGHIDLLVQDGFYSNRTDLIRTAIRNQIERHADAARQSVARKNLDLGRRHYTRDDLERRVRPGRRCTSGCWVSPASRPTSRPSSRAPRLRRSPSWGRCRPAPP